MIKLLSKIFFLIIFLNSFDISSKSKFISSEEIVKVEDQTEIPLNYLDYTPEDQYILGQGDKIAILFNNEELINKIFVIDNNGTIFTERLKRIYIEGLTIDELTNLLNQKYKEFIIDPNISVDIVQYRPIRVFINGEVVSPGSYLLGGKEIENMNTDQSKNYLERQNFKTDEMNSLISSDKLDFEKLLVQQSLLAPTLFDAIQLAEGITLYSDLSNIEVIRRNPLSKGGGKVKANINFLNVLEFGSSKQNIRLMDGDIINVRKSDYPLDEQYKKATSTNLQSQYNKVFISGRIEQPGLKLVNKSATLNDLILLSGGNKPLRGKIYHVRFNNDGTLTRTKIRYNKNAKDYSRNNPLLRSGDIVSVDSNFLFKTSSTLSEITNPFIGIFSSYSFFKMLSDIK